MQLFTKRQVASAQQALEGWDSRPFRITSGSLKPTC
jgi:hypothetical protein